MSISVSRRHRQRLESSAERQRKGARWRDPFGRKVSPAGTRTHIDGKPVVADEALARPARLQPQRRD
jgi:hypothetical protein